MSQTNYDELIPRMLARCRTIAVVGMSADPRRDSYYVSQYMQQHGYCIVPVNPSYAGTIILGEHCFPTLQAATDPLASAGQSIDMVNCFRRSDAMVLVAEEAIEIGALCLWMQLGVVNQRAADLAQDAGMAVVMDRCLKIEYSDL